MSQLPITYFKGNALPELTSLNLSGCKSASFSSNDFPQLQ